MNPVHRYLVRAHEIDPNSITALNQTLPRIDQALVSAGYDHLSRVQHQFPHQKYPDLPDGVTGIYFFNSQRDGLVQRPGHLTIHTWPSPDKKTEAEPKKSGSFALDLDLADSNELLLKNLQQQFPGKYQVIREFGGELSDRIPQQFGRQALAYLVNPKDRTYLNPERVISLLEEVSQEAKFKIAEENGTKRSLLRFNNDYLSAAVVLTTSHFIIDYLPKEGIVALNLFTCNEGGIDEGDPKLGLEKLVQRLNPQEIIHRVDLKR